MRDPAFVARTHNGSVCDQLKAHHGSSHRLQFGRAAAGGARPRGWHAAIATDGNPATNTPATIWPAYQYNAIQEELMAVILAAGITPDKANWAQLLAAIRTLARGGISVITGSGNFTVPTGITLLDVELWGGGAGSFAPIAACGAAAAQPADMRESGSPV